MPQTHSVHVATVSYAMGRRLDDVDEVEVVRCQGSFSAAVLSTAQVPCKL